MAKLILHSEADVDAINERRLNESMSLTHQERIRKAFQLMRLSILFKNGAIKKPQGKGVVLKYT